MKNLKIRELLESKAFRIAGGILFFLIGMLLLFFYERQESTLEEENVAVSFDQEKKSTEQIHDTFYVDIKGAVKKPGVYAMKSGSIVNDVIKEAGGLTKNAVTSNINLSKQVTNEMVIYVFTKNQIKKTTTPVLNDVPCVCETIEVNQCIQDTTGGNGNASDNETSKKAKKVNLNTASKEELMTVSGIGESKAEAIIAYRSEQKFTTIEEIKNVSGIGDALFAKIKDYITV